MTIKAEDFIENETVTDNNITRIKNDKPDDLYDPWNTFWKEWDKPVWPWF